MSVVLTVLITTSGTVLVALFTTLGAVFGPAWRESRLQAAARVTQKEDARFDRARELVAAAYAWSERAGSKAEVYAARAGFIATLRSGEGAVAARLRFDLDLILRAPGNAGEVDILGDVLFGYLRGDVALSEIRMAMPER